MRATIAIPLLVALAACGDAPRHGTGGEVALGEALGGTAHAGFARATAPPSLVFPRDHGAHRDYRTEWWYVTGNLATEAGRRFGVQLVFFRQAIAPAADVAPRAAALAARETVLAHAALTDVDGRRFHHEQRLARAAAGLGAVSDAGDTLGPAAPFFVVCADWSATSQPGGDGFLPLRLHAAGADFAFTLDVAPGKPLVLQGDRGLSQKSDEPGNASIYYSMTRLPIAGTVRVDDGEHVVRGDAWLDREWSTSALGAEQVGWDWFSLQLDDGTEVMWYQLRTRDGRVDRWSRGCLVARDGTSTPLALANVAATPHGEWRARDGGAAYPARWQLTCREPAFDLTIEPVLPDQELRVLVRYWEGAVAVRGTRAGTAITGRGYLEMTGYTRAR